MNIETITNNFRQKMTVVNFSQEKVTQVSKKKSTFFKRNLSLSVIWNHLMRILNQRHADATEIHVHAYWYSFNFESLSPKNWPSMGFN